MGRPGIYLLLPKRGPGFPYDSGKLSLGAEIAHFTDDAVPAAGLAGDADITSMQNQPMMGILEKLGGDDPHEPAFDLQRGLASGKACAIGKAQNVGIHT